MENCEASTQLRDLCRRIGVRPWEADLRRRAAAFPPQPGRLPPVPVIRAQGELDEIDWDRRDALARLQALAREPDAGLIEKAQAAGIPSVLSELRAQPWCPRDLARDIEQLAARLSPPPAADPGGEQSPDRDLGWRLLYPFLSLSRFPRWSAQDAAVRHPEEDCPLTIKLFISHRWATPDDPDPEHQHLQTVVECLSRVFLGANGLARADSLPLQELVIGDTLRAAFQLRQLDCCRCGTIGWLDLRSSLLGSQDLLFSHALDITTRRNFYRLLKHVHVWYDYCSLPQARETREEEAFLDRALTRLAEIVGGSEVLTLWGVESLRRAWCLFEVLAARQVHFCAPAQTRASSSDQMLARWALSDDREAAESAAYRGRPSVSISAAVQQFRRDVTGLGEGEILNYLRQHGIDCSKPSDLLRLSHLIHRYLAEDVS